MKNLKNEVIVLLLFILTVSCTNTKKDEVIFDGSKNVYLKKSGNNYTLYSNKNILGFEIFINNKDIEISNTSDNLLIIESESKLSIVGKKQILKNDPLFNVSSNIVTNEKKQFEIIDTIDTSNLTKRNFNNSNEELLGDFNDDSSVDLIDFLDFVKSYGSSKGEVKYNEKGDIYPSKKGADSWKDIYCIKTIDNKINLGDFVVFANNYGKSKPEEDEKLTYRIVDTNVSTFYSNNSVINEPSSEEDYFGQDATYEGNTPSFTNNNNRTITDNVTGLMWQQEMGEKITFDEAFIKAETLDLGGFNDWRVPTIKELYSLIQFTGSVSGQVAGDMFIDINYFHQPLGDTSIGEREIDAQTWSSTEYVGKTMNKDETVFGVNFVDGRIKGYPKYDPRYQTPKKMYFRMVRGNEEYGKNKFIDNGDGTISDYATGLMWQKNNSEIGLDWKDSLEYAENLELSGYNDWKLPNAKELQSIVDYSRSLQTTNSASIDPIFEISQISDPNGNINYPYFWTSTTHLDGVVPESSAVYVSFGEAQGKMFNTLMDVHGAGSQRSDPKSGDENLYPQFFGPQGDVRYVYNYVRCVREF